MEIFEIIAFIFAIVFWLTFWDRLNRIMKATEALAAIAIGGRFIVSEPVSGEIIVADTSTKLMWQGSYIKGKTWEDAISYSKSLHYGGYEDWRLPTKEELKSLINKSRKKPASDFPEMPSERFWSSSSYAKFVSSAWYVDFYDGRVSFVDGRTGYFVRCVRG